MKIPPTLLALAIAGLPLHPALTCDSASCSVKILPISNPVSSIKNGNWSNPAIWSTGMVPKPGQNVIIAASKIVTMDVAMANNSTLQSVRIDGTLQFSPTKNTRLIVDTILVNTTGTLTMGTSTAPINPNNTAELIFSGPDIAIGTVPGAIGYDGELKGRGLLSHGCVKVYGSAKTPYVDLSTALGAITGKVVKLASAPAGWRVGDEVLVTGSRYTSQTYGNGQYYTKGFPGYIEGHPGFKGIPANDYETEDEVRVITAVSGTALTLDSELTVGFHARSHPGMPIRIANLTRNVVFATDPANVNYIQRRGHTMFMNDGTENGPVVSLNYAAFVNLGRTSKDNPVTAFEEQTDPAQNMRGRYPVHFHKTGREAQPVIMDSCVIRCSPGWGMSLHSTNGLIKNNVSYDVFAAHFVAEDGDERGSFVRNLAVKSVGDFERGIKEHGHADPVGPVGHEIQDDGARGHGFWFQSRNLRVTDNVAVSHADDAFVYFHRRVDGLTVVPTSDLLAPTSRLLIADKRRDLNSPFPLVNYDDVPVTKSERNTGVASRGALHVIKANNEPGHDVRSVFSNWKGFNTKRGIELQYTGHYLFRNCELYAQSDLGQAPDAGLYHGNRVVDTTYLNFKVSGWTRPIMLTKKFQHPNGGPLLFDTPAMLYVGGRVKIKDSADEVDFDVTNHSASPHVWAKETTLEGAAHAAWYDWEIHQIAPFNAALMDPISGPNPPSPVIVGSYTLRADFLNAHPSQWSDADITIRGIKTDAAGSQPNVPGKNVDSFTSLWKGSVLRAIVASGNIRTQGTRKFIDLPDHTSDRTSGRLTQFTVPVELVP